VGSVNRGEMFNPGTDLGQKSHPGCGSARMNKKVSRESSGHPSE